MKQVVDGGSGLLSNRVCRRRRLLPLLVVASCGAGAVWELDGFFLKRPDVFMLCDKAALLLVFIYIYIYIYICIPEIYVIT